MMLRPESLPKEVREADAGHKVVNDRQGTDGERLEQSRRLKHKGHPSKKHQESPRR